MSEEKAALAFAQSKPTEWEAFKLQWLKQNPEPQPPIVEPLMVVESVEPQPKRKRKTTLEE